MYLGKYWTQIVLLGRRLTTAMQPVDNRGADHSTQEWPQACHPMVSALLTPDQDPVFHLIPDELDRDRASG
jgi:hypothetical protein